MNFLSHYYFDRHVTDCYHILGTVLPDLLKNADKTIVLHPEALQHHNPNVNNIIAGWNKHLDVDRHFHSSDYFKTHSHQLKKNLLPAITGSPVKPFFLGHIAIELVLDGLLINNHQIGVDSFYDHLHSCKHDVIKQFFIAAGLPQHEFFFRYFEKFKADRYLQTYADIAQITYALKRICMRIWPHPFTTENEEQMTKTLSDYSRQRNSDFMLIFNEIKQKLYSS